MAEVVEEKTKSWQKKEENSVQTKGSGGWEEFLGMKAKPVATGKYRIEWYAQVRRTSGGTTPCFRVRWDDSNTIGYHAFPAITNEWQSTSGWDIKTLTEGEKPRLSIEVRGKSGNGNIEMRRLKLSIEYMEE